MLKPDDIECETERQYIVSLVPVLLLRGS